MAFLRLIAYPGAQLNEKNEGTGKGKDLRIESSPPDWDASLVDASTSPSCESFMTCSSASELHSSNDNNNENRNADHNGNTGSGSDSRAGDKEDFQVIDMTTLASNRETSPLQVDFSASLRPVLMTSSDPGGVPEAVAAAMRNNINDASGTIDKIVNRHKHQEEYSLHQHPPFSPAEHQDRKLQDQDIEPRKRLLLKLQEVSKSAREAEMLHAYDVGVQAALLSMQTYWASKARELHISNPERRIFKRENERLSDLLKDTAKVMLASDQRLAAKQALERRLAEEVYGVEGVEVLERFVREGLGLDRERGEEGEAEDDGHNEGRD